MSKSLQVAVVGGGAAGMTAAIAAARAGARVALFEAQDRVGRKLLATGNGRCNLTNTACSVANYHGVDPRFVEPALAQLPPAAAVEFFNELGACTVVEDEGRVYPLTGQSSTVLDVLRLELERLGVALRTKAAVREVRRLDGCFDLHWHDGRERADRVIVAGGGKAAPQLGGTDSAVALLRRLGHAAVPMCPALVPLKTSARFSRHVKGVRVSARARLDTAGRPERTEQGEVQFTEYGLSGIPIMQLSLSASQARQSQAKVGLSLDLLPDWSAEQLQRHLADRFSRHSATPLEIAMVGLVHKRLIPVVLHEAGIDETHQACAGLSAAQVGAIANLLKEWRFGVSGSLSWNDAQVMAGGIATSELRPDTLESRLAPGIFAAGEVLDVAGDCGGYNLQWAWASGHLAGRQAAAQA